jgi:hypothetical protein
MVWGLDWISGSGSGLSTPASTAPRSNDGGYVAPDRSKREVCYESRDIFFQCLDKNNILDAIKEDDKARQVCPTEVTAYEKDCARSWVSLIDPVASASVTQSSFSVDGRLIVAIRSNTSRRNE